MAGGLVRRPAQAGSSRRVRGRVARREMNSVQGMHATTPTVRSCRPEEAGSSVVIVVTMEARGRRTALRTSILVKRTAMNQGDGEEE
jgi:hypothetical protein